MSSTKLPENYPWYMGEQRHTVRKITGTVLFGLFTLPPLIFGSYLGICWIRIHTTNLYYVDCPFLLLASISIAIAGLGISLILYGVWRKSYYGLLFVPAILFGLIYMVQIPDLIPHVRRSMVADSNYLSDTRAFLQSWYEENNRFPNNQAEFKDAMAKGPTAWRNQIGPLPVESAYSQHGKRLPYEIVILTNANGPRLDNLSPKPGVVYYSISTDQRRFWITMTGLQNDISASAKAKRIADLPSEPVLVMAVDKSQAQF